MKKIIIGLSLLCVLGCAKKRDHPARQSIAKLKSAITAGRGDAVLEQLSPSAIRELSSRLGLGQKGTVKQIGERLSVVPGVGFEKVSSFQPELMTDRSSALERWYRIELGGQRMQVPVRKVGETWKVALNEAVVDD